jgi:hypothetical protein
VLSIFKDKYNREIGSYKDGKYDTIAVQGRRHKPYTQMLNYKVLGTIND